MRIDTLKSRKSCDVQNVNSPTCRKVEFTENIRKSSFNATSINIEALNHMDVKLKYSKWTIAGLWILALAIGETMSFRYVANCHWASETSYRLAIIADVHLANWHSVNANGPGTFRTKVEEYLTDQYMKRNFHALLDNTPHGVMVLGDLFDQGRTLEDEEFEQHVERYNQIFHPKLNAMLEFYNMSGNLDVGMSGWHNPRIMERFQSQFGKTNYVASLGDFDVVVVDSVGLITPGSKVETDALAFIDSLRNSTTNRPRLLCTHIPLHRTHDQPCGSRRKRRSIHQEYGISTQRLLPADISNELLNVIQPDYITSGNDHDSCYYEHAVQMPGKTMRKVPEYTVATFNWRQRGGVPEIAMMQYENGQFHLQICNLPDQASIYLVYMLLVASSLLVISATFMYEICNLSHFNKDSKARQKFDNSDGFLVSSVLSPRNLNLTKLNKHPRLHVACIASTRALLFLAIPILLTKYFIIPIIF